MLYLRRVVAEQRKLKDFGGVVERFVGFSTRVLNESFNRIMDAIFWKIVSKQAIYFVDEEKAGSPKRKGKVVQQTIT